MREKKKNKNRIVPGQYLLTYLPGGMGPYSSGLQVRPVGPDQIREGFVEAKSSCPLKDGNDVNRRKRASRGTERYDQNPRRRIAGVTGTEPDNFSRWFTRLGKC